MIQTLRSYYATAVADLRHQGVEVLLWRIFVKLMSPVARMDLQILFEIDLSQPLQVRAARIPCRVERAGEDDIDAILDMQMRRFTPEEEAALSDAQQVQYARLLRARANAHRSYQRQLRAGEQCYVARVDDGRIGHSNWTRFHDNDFDASCPVTLKPGEIYTTDAFTADEFRGKGLHEAVLTTMLAAAQQRGAVRAFTITDITKAGSRRGVQRVGWRRRGSIMHLSLRGVKRRWLLRVAGDLEPIFAHVRAHTAMPD